MQVQYSSVFEKGRVVRGDSCSHHLRLCSSLKANGNTQRSNSKYSGRGFRVQQQCLQHAGLTAARLVRTGSFMLL